MNAKTDKWESYTDKAGRRHWRWPAANEQLAARPVDDEHHDAAAPRWLQRAELREQSQGD